MFVDRHTLKEGDIEAGEVKGLDFKNAVYATGDLDGTLYDLLVIPESKYEYALVISTLERSAYRFRINGYISPDYFAEKMIGDYKSSEGRFGIKDAENHIKVLNEAFKLVREKIAKK